MVLSPARIATLARNAGFSGNDLTIAVAIALAESGGKVNSYNAELAAGTPAGLGSYGLWQIYRNAHPELNGLDLYDPQLNANAAYAVYKQAGFSFHPWSTYKNDDYLAKLDAAEIGVSA